MHRPVSRREALAVFGSVAGSMMLPAEAGAAGPAATTVLALAAGASEGTLYKANARAVYRSTDGGRSWRDLRLPLASGARIHAIGLSAAHPEVIYAAGSRLGVMRSSDGGARWTRAGKGLPAEVTAIAPHARQAGTVYAYAPGRGIYRSEDAGSQWRLMDSGPRGGITHFVHSDMPGSMQTGWLFAAGPKGVRLSMDCFCGWRNAGELASGAHAIAYDPRRPARVAAATSGGVLESSDGGQTWTRLPPLPERVAALTFGASGILHAAAGAGLYRRNAGAWEALDA